MTRRGPIRIVDLGGSPEAIGHEHGRRFAGEIRDYLDDRLHIVESGAWSGRGVTRDEAIALATACLVSHERYSPQLYAELVALADGAGITAAEAVIVGGFTDFVDLVRAVTGEPASVPPAEDDCTAFVVPASQTGGAGLLGQTWDMHDTATEHVVLLRIRPDDGPAAAVFTTFGCVGQLGMNELGVCIGINNLSAANGRPGVTWPFVVRAVLASASADEAAGRVADADLAGGHSYLALDAGGSGWCIEALPDGSYTDMLHDAPLVHTNHTLYDSTTALQAPRSPALQAGSIHRLETAARFLERDVVTADDLMALTRLPDAICLDAAPPLHLETSGAAVMDPANRRLWAVWGKPTENDYTLVDVAPR